MRQGDRILWPFVLMAACGAGLLLIGQLIGLLFLAPGLLGLAAHLISRRQRPQYMDDDEAEEAARQALLADVLRVDAERREKESP